MFLGGFMSDMTGTKATALEAHCRRVGRAFVRFDYRGHGQSAGRFIDGTVGLWRDDALAVLDELTAGPQVLVGSSMGGWIMLLVALARPRRVAGLVGVAAAPDFVTRMWQDFTPEIRSRIERDGVYHRPSQYSDAPYAITRQLLAEGRQHLLLQAPVSIACPVRLLHGMLDPDVPWRLSLEVAEKLSSDDVTVTLVKQGDHRMSEPADIARLLAAVDELAEHPAAPPAA
ncbi:MAG: alpha/beta hydrolase [Alphaproteobacteria bacterium]|nr:alpha/beta hydrolase [Alphaproteobacteria bacterium]